MKKPFYLSTLILSFCVFACKSPAPQPPLQLVELEEAEAAKRAEEIRNSISPEIMEGLKLSLWASDSLLADPIALEMDNQGNAYITRTNRQKNSEFDIRGHRDWMTASISLASVEDRRAFLHRIFSPDSSEKNTWVKDLNNDSIHDWRDLAVEKEQVYRISDESGDGIADRSQLILEDFNDEVTDPAGALLVYGEDMFLGAGPDLWRLKDRNGDGTIDWKKSISHGYIVHIGFGGHGMSGLTVGPDGKIYWGAGDVGSNITALDGSTYNYPNQGVIVRCNPDGSDFEVYAAGLRNTHEFVFDNYGNLITVDNDGDHPGEKERLLYVVNGHDAGWRINWQFGKYTDPDNNTYKVWMEEEMYKPRWEGQAAYFLPPIINYHSGPTGMLHNPGTALSPDLQDKFLVVEFNGSASRSGIHAFDLKPKGASFEMGEETVVMRGVLGTGIRFGSEGALYIADWITGWGTKNYGRIWKLDDPLVAASPSRQEVKTLLQSNFSEMQVADLGELLKHVDKRIRQNAQFALAAKGNKGLKIFEETLTSDHQLARIHALWGITQQARKDSKNGQLLLPLLTDQDKEIRAQAAKMLGDIRYEAAGDALIPLLKDPSNRVKFFSAEALGRIAHKAGTQPILDMLEANDNVDHYLRFGGALALSRIGDREKLLNYYNHPSQALRLAVVLAMRRMRDPAIANFLEDEDEYIVAEAARAINDDYSIEEALPMLADCLENERFTSEPLLRRAINANLRVGELDELEQLIAYAQSEKAPAEMRKEALAAIGTWAKPSVLDRVDGRYRGPDERDEKVLKDMLAPHIETFIGANQKDLQIEACKIVGKLGLKEAEEQVLSLTRPGNEEEVRVAALKALFAMESGEMEGLLAMALNGKSEKLRVSALTALPKLNMSDDKKAEMLAGILKDGSLSEKQTALAQVGNLKSAKATETLQMQIELAEKKQINPGVLLDLENAVAQNTDEKIVAAWEAYQASIVGQDSVSKYRAALDGGTRQAGVQVYINHPAAQCTRCHAIDQWGSSEVGPNLGGLAKRMSREDILESLVSPSAKVALGYGIVSLELEDGESLVGTLLEENSRQLILKTEDAEPVKVPLTKIKTRRDAPSSMPAMGILMEKEELRDLVAFLATLK